LFYFYCPALQNLLPEALAIEAAVIATDSAIAAVNAAAAAIFTVIFIAANTAARDYPIMGTIL
jgi:hypothetical protein